jgi:hypothetical protein
VAPLPWWNPPDDGTTSSGVGTSMRVQPSEDQPDADGIYHASDGTMCMKSAKGQRYPVDATGLSHIPDTRWTNDLPTIRHQLHRLGHECHVTRSVNAWQNGWLKRQGEPDDTDHIPRRSSWSFQRSCADHLNRRPRQMTALRQPFLGIRMGCLRGQRSDSHASPNGPPYVRSGSSSTAPARGPCAASGLPHHALLNCRGAAPPKTYRQIAFLNAVRRTSRMQSRNADHPCCKRP